MSNTDKGMENAGRMFKAFMAQQGMGDELKTASKMMFDLYTELKNAGFNRHQAMAILLTTIQGGMK